MLDKDKECSSARLSGRDGARPRFERFWGIATGDRQGREKGRADTGGDRLTVSPDVKVPWPAVADGSGGKSMATIRLGAGIGNHFHEWT